MKNNCMVGEKALGRKRIDHKAALRCLIALCLALWITAGQAHAATIHVTSISDAVPLVSQGGRTIIASQSGDGNYFTAPDVEQSFNVTADSDNDGVGDSSDVDDDGDGLIEISSLADLDEMRNDLAGASLYGVTAGCPSGGCIGYELTTDLDFDTNGNGEIDAGDDYWNSGEGWQPIGDNSTPFTGTFNGNHFEIRNLFINRPTENRLGLFGVVNNATLTGLGLTGDLTSVTGDDTVAILAGLLLSNSAISDCYTGGSLNLNNFGGGLIAELYDNSTISSSFSTTTVTCTGSDCGSLVGGAFDGTSIENSYASGVVGVNDTIGSLIGFLYSADIVNCYGIGEVSGNTSTGGLIGWNTGTSSVTASYWDTETTGLATSYGGTGLTTTELQCPTGPDDTACAGATLYEGWDTAVWDFGTSSQYPALIINGNVYRDSDGDGIWDFEDTSSSFPWAMFLPAITGNSAQ